MFIFVTRSFALQPWLLGAPASCATVKALLALTALQALDIGTSSPYIYFTPWGGPRIIQSSDCTIPEGWSWGAVQFPKGSLAPEIQ